MHNASAEFEKLHVRIPALLRGLEYAHTMYGKLQWQDVVEPSAILAGKGFEVSRDFAYEATKNVNLGLFGHINGGETLMLPKLAKTLQLVSKFGTKGIFSVFFFKQNFKRLH
jgi:gamma-glutamyltranspeptidase